MSDLPPLKMEKCFMCLLCVSGHSEYFLRNLLRGWDPGRPPPVGTNSQLSPVFFDGTPKFRQFIILTAE